MSYDESTRCFGNKDPLMAEYHDREWGVPTHDESELFGLIILEGAQAGLSWRTVLHRREAYREAFAGFDPLVVSRYTPEEYGSFAKYLWAYVDHKPVMNHFTEWSDVPAQTDLSKAISVDLKKRGFSFVGPTIMYAYMQSVGMVNDHLTSCFRHDQILEEYGP